MTKDVCSNMVRAQAVMSVTLLPVRDPNPLPASGMLRFNLGLVFDATRRLHGMIGILSSLRKEGRGIRRVVYSHDDSSLCTWTTEIAT